MSYKYGSQTVTLKSYVEQTEDQIVSLENKFRTEITKMNAEQLKEVEENLKTATTKDSNRITCFRVVKNGALVEISKFPEIKNMLISAGFNPITEQKTITITNAKGQQITKDVIYTRNNLKDSFKDGEGTLQAIRFLKGFSGVDKTFLNELNRVETEIRSGNTKVKINGEFDDKHKMLVKKSASVSKNIFQNSQDTITIGIGQLTRHRNILKNKLSIIKELKAHAKISERMKENDEITAELCEKFQLRRIESLNSIAQKYVLA